MELEFNGRIFSESPETSNADFFLKPGDITSFYNLRGLPMIQIRINTDKYSFLRKIDANPRIRFSDGLTHIYAPFEKIKNKII